MVARVLLAKSDKEAIAGWKGELNRILHVFNVCSIALAWSTLTFSFQTELAMNTHVAVSDIRHDVSKIRDEIGGQVRSVSAGTVQSVDRCMLTVA